MKKYIELVWYAGGGVVRRTDVTDKSDGEIDKLLKTKPKNPDEFYHRFIETPEELETGTLQ